MHTRIVLAVTVLVAGAACRDASPSAPDNASEGRALASGEITASDRWMRLTRAIIGRREVGSPLAPARNFALVAVAGYNSAVAAGAAPSNGGRRPSEAGAVAGAAATVLRALYPMEDTAIVAQLNADRSYFASIIGETPYDFSGGETLGGQLAAQVLTRAAGDRSNAVWTGTIPTGPGNWLNAPAPAQPIAPLWGQARGWFLSTGDQFRPVAPPAVTSAAYATDLAEVRTAAAARTPAQLTVAQFWQFASGPAGPMGHFTEVANGLTSAAQMNERRTARVYAVMHMAIFDATVACWDAKYAYWYIRPFQADPTITTPVGRPNFPSYPSAHSCITGTAAGVLTGLFPSAKAVLDAKIVEAGEARIYAGLHFRFDITAGQEIGAKVSGLALTRVPAKNSAIPLQ
jgi:membrane-associated phospholipid phosphatase